MTYTCSSVFLVRQLDIDSKTLMSKELGFINAYTRDKNRPREDDLRVLYLLFRPESMSDFSLFLEYEKDADEFLENYNYDGGYMVIAYTLPPRLKLDYERFDRGEYSKLSKEFQKAYTKEMRAYDVINKTDNMKQYWSERTGYDFFEDENLELWDKPTEESETLDIDKLKQE